MGVLKPLDWTIILVYFAVILGLAWKVMRQKQKTSDEYFLAGRNLGWLIVGASIFASNIGAEHLVGLAGSGATDGVAMAHYELHAWCLLVLGWVMVPFYMRSRVFTMPEFLERRFSPAARTVLSLISLVAYVLTKMAVGIFAGGVVFSVLLPELNWFGLDSFWIGSILVIVITGLYTIMGGLKAVAYTEAIQTFVLIVGSALVTYFGLKALGGWGQLREIAQILDRVERPSIQLELIRLHVAQKLRHEIVEGVELSAHRGEPLLPQKALHPPGLFHEESAHRQYFGY